MNPTQELVVWSFTVWRCEVCGGIAQFYPNEAEPGTQIVCGGFECNGLMSQVEVIPLATHQALEVRVGKIEKLAADYALRLCKVNEIANHYEFDTQPDMLEIHKLSAFNNQPTGTEGDD